MIRDKKKEKKKKVFTFEQEARKKILKLKVSHPVL